MGLDVLYYSTTAQGEEPQAAGGAFCHRARHQLSRKQLATNQKENVEQGKTAHELRQSCILESVRQKRRHSIL